MKRSICKAIVSLVILMLVVSSCSTPPPVTVVMPTASSTSSAVSMENLIAAAQGEGSVTVYSVTSRIKDVVSAFEEKYPGIKVTSFQISSTEMISRLKNEANANVVGADLAYLADSSVVFGELVKNGTLENYVPPNFEGLVPAEYQQPLIANRLSTRVLLYNEATYPNGAPVKNLWELTEPKWRGKVLMVDPLLRGEWLDLMVQIVLHSDEMAKAYEQLYGKPIQLDAGTANAGQMWIYRLLANGAVLVKDQNQVYSAIGETGQAQPPVGFGSYNDIRSNKEKGFALQIANDVVPSPGYTFPTVLGIVRNAQHPNAAKLLITFMMGDLSPNGGVGFAPFYIPGDYPTRTDIKGHPDALPLERLRAWTMDPAKTYEIRQQVSDLILKWE